MLSSIPRFSNSPSLHFSVSPFLRFTYSPPLCFPHSQILPLSISSPKPPALPAVAFFDLRSATKEVAKASPMPLAFPFVVRRTPSLPTSLPTSLKLRWSRKASLVKESYGVYDVPYAVSIDRDPATLTVQIDL
jgi:hypothetical protein